MNIQYCPKCGAYWQENCNNPGSCMSCGQSVTGDLASAMAESNAAILKEEAIARIEDISALSVGLANITAFHAQEYLRNIWNILKPRQREDLVQELVNRLLERILEGKLDHQLEQGLKKEIEGDEAPGLISELLGGSYPELASQLGNTLAERVEGKLQDEGGDVGRALNLVVLAKLNELAQELFDKQRQGIEAQVRDRIAAELPELVDKAVKQITERAIDEVRRKVERN